MAKAERVVLIDGSWLVLRAFFAIPPTFATAGGIHTNATYGFATMFRKLFAGRRPTHGAVVFDAPGKVFRKEKFAAYKADRPPMPPELREQVPWIDRVAAANGFPVVRCPGWEADDVIGTLARVATEAGHEVLIVAGDKDFAQLIDDRVRMFDSMRDVTYDAALAAKKWGVQPGQMVDFLALMGDSVDGIPGVAGIGEKSAAALLAAYGDLAGVYANLAALPARQRSALEAGREAAELSRELATIDRFAPIAVTLADLALPEPDPAALDAVYRELEFRSLLSARTETAAIPEIDAATARAWFAAGRVAIVPDPAGLQLMGPSLGILRDVGAIADLLADPAVPKVAHDCKALRIAGCDDTMLASFLVDPTKVIPHRLEQVVREYLGRAPAEPARDVLELWGVLSRKLEEAGQTEVYRDQELPLAAVLGQMQRDGILVDRADLDRLGVEFRARRDALEHEIHALAGHPFNLGSTAQLATVLFEELKLPVIKKIKTGYSTDAEVLQTLAAKHPICARLLEHRALAKLINTYTDVLAAAVDADGRIHANFQQTVGVSGRIISTDPDLQRTPVRTPEGRRIREAFIAPPGWVMLSADWSQVELRVLAHLSQDPRLVEAFRADRDVHRETAMELFGTSAPSPEQRTIGKTINFATIYGQGATALAQILGIPRKEAQAHIDRFFATYAGVRAWLDATIAEATRTGFVTTIAGRRRHIRELASLSPMDRQAGERIAANTPIQGSAADLCKIAMLGISRRLGRARMLLQVHDELVFEVPEDDVEAVRAMVIEEMTAPMSLRVPLKVNVGVGRSWGAAH